MRALPLVIIATAGLVTACMPGAPSDPGTFVETRPGKGGSSGQSGRGGQSGNAGNGAASSGGASGGGSTGAGGASVGSGGSAGAASGGNGASPSGSGGSTGSGDASAGGNAGGGNMAGDAGGAGEPPASGGDEGLKQLLVTSALGIGYYTACHIMPDLGVKCFGDDHPRTRPPAGIKTRQMTCAHDGCCALMPKEAGNRVTCWSDKRTIFPPADVAKSVDPIQIGIGYQHGCALNVDHSVTCWGQPGTMNAPPPGLKAKNLAVAAYFNCAVTMDDSVVCWGINPPPPPAGLKAKLVTGIFHGGGHLDEAKGGTRHACAIKLDGTVTCWGDNIDGTTDVPATLGVVKDISAATYNTCAVKPDGELICWGTKRWMNQPERWIPRPPNLKLKGIRGKFASHCGIQLDDTIVCWGEEKTTHLTVPPGTKAFVP